MKADSLEILGLTKYEALAYEALLRLGKASAFEIARESGVPYGRIYDTLNVLVGKGMVAVIPEKTKLFTPATPDTLKKLVVNQEEKLSAIKKELEHLKNIYKPVEEPVEIAKGKKNFYQMVNKMPEPSKYIYTFKYASEITPAFVREVKKHINRGMDSRMFVKYDEHTKHSILKWKKLVPKLKQRKFDFDKLAIQITDDNAVLLALVESNVTVIIRDKQFVRLMRKLFETAWEKAEEV